MARGAGGARSTSRRQGGGVVVVVRSATLTPVENYLLVGSTGYYVTTGADRSTPSLLAVRPIRFLATFVSFDEEGT